MQGSFVTAARFPDVPAGAGHYESFYVKACHPDEPIALWIRHTVHKRPGAEPVGSVWLTLFDTREPGPWAVKQSTQDLEAGAGRYIRVGDSVLEPGLLRGGASAQGLEASWEISFSGPEPPLRHLPRDFMYRAPLPRTKLLSPYPDARFDGSATVGGRQIDLRGWRGMVGHNWGAQHAERWIWIHASDFEERPGAWVDIALGKVRIGPVTTPWIANGAISLDGVRHRLGGVGWGRRPRIDESPSGCRIALRGEGIALEGRLGADLQDFVGWIYADPDGSEHNVVNCSVCDAELVVAPSTAARTTLTARASAAYELGMRESGGVPLQPFGDG